MGSRPNLDRLPLLLLLRAALAHVPGATVGIDLGTTNSAIAILRDGAPVIVPNGRGELTTPSAVAFAADGTTLVGTDALEQAASNVANTVYAAKRFIGRPLARVRGYVKNVGFAVIDAGDDAVAFEIPAVGAPVTPEEASAHLLRALLDDAESATGTRAERAVITVPAYFDDRQRRATRAAAALAGLTEVDMLAEPVAASLAYGLSGAVGTLVVFDLGAGTFDVSVLRRSASGDVEVVATSGDARLGGNDFDAALVAWLEKQGAAQGWELQGDQAAMRQLADAAEAAKKRLSVVKSVQVARPYADADAAATTDASSPGSTAAHVELSREQLEQLCDPILRRLRTPLYEAALTARITLPGELEPEYGKPKRQLSRKARRAAAKLRPEGRQKYLPTGDAVDEVILVGGATHMVAVRKLVANVFGVDPRRTVDPMQAVALGAAVHAGVLAGEVGGTRVLQAWQAQLGRMLEPGGGGEESAASDDVSDLVGELSDGTQPSEGAAEEESQDAAESAEEEAAVAAWLAAQRKAAGT